MPKTKAEPAYRLPGDTKAVKRSEIFNTDHLPEFITTTDIERHYRRKAATVRNILSRARVAGKPAPFIVLPCRPMLINRVSFENWLLGQSNAQPAQGSATSTTTKKPVSGTLKGVAQ